MTDSTPISKLRRQILGNRGIVLSERTKKPIKISDLPDEYPKTPEMKYLEQKLSIHLEKVIFIGSLNDVRKKLNWEVDRSTVSRWRKHIRKHLGIVEYYGGNNVS